MDAFNASSAERGNLYKSPIFLSWAAVENIKTKLSSVGASEFLIADVFNSDEPVLVFKRSPGTGFLAEIVREFFDVSEFKSTLFESEVAIARDHRATRIVA